MRPASFAQLSTALVPLAQNIPKPIRGLLKLTPTVRCLAQLSQASSSSPQAPRLPWLHQPFGPAVSIAEPVGSTISYQLRQTCWLDVFPQLRLIHNSATRIMIILLSELKLRDVYYQIRNNFPYLRIFTKTLSTLHTTSPTSASYTHQRDLKIVQASFAFSGIFKTNI